ncbi:MAG TPA: acyl-ACP thioesterase domain-containing protein [Clostridia bacterium]
MKSVCSYTRKFIVTIYDVDFRGVLKPSSILNYFQEVATSHSLELKVDYFSLLKHNEFWILSRICVEIDKYPKLGDEITVVTYPIEPRMVDCDRDYYILDKDGNTLIRGVSKWLILDLETHKIKRVNPNYFSGIEFIDKRAIENPCWKVEPADNMKEIYQSAVRLDDIDFNHHMNNAKYITAAFNAFSPEEILDKRIKSFSINFLSEMSFNQEYVVKKLYNSQNDVIIEIESDNKPACRAQLLFEADNGL